MKYAYLLPDGSIIREKLPDNKSVLQRMGDFNAMAAWESDKHPHQSGTLYRNGQQQELPV